MTNLIDLSGFIQHLKRFIWKWIWRKEVVKPAYKDFSLAPFDCSYCATWWTGLIYLIVTSQFNIFTLAMLLIVAWLTSYMAEAQRLIGDLIVKFFELIYKLFGL